MIVRLEFYLETPLPTDADDLAKLVREAIEEKVGETDIEVRIDFGLSFEDD